MPEKNGPYYSYSHEIWVLSISKYLPKLRLWGNLSHSFIIWIPRVHFFNIFFCVERWWFNLCTISLALFQVIGMFFFPIWNIFFLINYIVQILFGSVVIIYSIETYISLVDYYKVWKKWSVDLFMLHNIRIYNI